MEVAKNTNSVMERIKVETMKSHALADWARVEAMAALILERVPFHADFQKIEDMLSLINGLRRMWQKSDMFRYIRLDLFSENERRL